MFSNTMNDSPEEEAQEGEAPQAGSQNAEFQKLLAMLGQESGKKGQEAAPKQGVESQAPSETSPKTPQLPPQLMAAMKR